MALSPRNGYRRELSDFFVDYIWVIDPPDRRVAVTRLLQPHTTDNLEPGLPRKGVCGSDHVSLAAEVRWEGCD